MTKYTTRTYYCPTVKKLVIIFGYKTEEHDSDKLITAVPENPDVELVQIYLYPDQYPRCNFTHVIKEQIAPTTLVDIFYSAYHVVKRNRIIYKGAMRKRPTIDLSQFNINGLYQLPQMPYVPAEGDPVALCVIS